MDNHHVPEYVLFDPDDYLTRHFSGALHRKNTVLMDFYAQIYSDLAGCSFLEFGGGPTIYAIISAAGTADWIHFADYSPGCRREITKWLAADPEAFDWSAYTRYALRRERGDTAEIGPEEVEARHALIRQRIRAVSPCDAWAADPLLGNSLGPYGVVAANFCLESVTSDKATWLELNAKLARLVAPAGMFVTTSLWNVDSYIHNGASYSSVALTPEDIRRMYMTLGFRVGHLETVELEPGYGYIMACGRKVVGPSVGAQPLPRQPQR